MRVPRHFDDEFKREAIRLVKNSSKTKAEISRDLGISPSTLHSWVNKSVEAKDGTIITDSEITRLKRELADVKLERDILKKARTLLFLKIYFTLDSFRSRPLPILKTKTNAIAFRSFVPDIEISSLHLSTLSNISCCSKNTFFAALCPSKIASFPR